ncbi:MAG TPA: AbrB/MazE/SpoVT family DNA-binding domain-containing protein [Burkholderiales bacterium]|nr:AbrB/MazE/SpoVT family DNA-binding domain-containing protein [Burkholderiales bacterium]
MLAKRTVKNQITLPKAIASQFPDVEYFEVRTENQRIILEPLRRGQADAVREKLAALKISDGDITDAIRWARKKKP